MNKIQRRPGRPSVQESSENQQKILAVAMDHFLKLGFANTSIDTIAAECGVTRGAIYNRYPNKAALLSAVCTMCGERFYTSHMPVAAPGETFASRAHAHARAIVGAVINQGVDLYRLLSYEAPGTSEIQNSFHEVWHFYMQSTRELIERGVREKAIRIDDVETGAELFLTYIYSTINLRLVFHLPIPDETELYRHCDLAVDMFLRGSDLIHA